MKITPVEATKLLSWFCIWVGLFLLSTWQVATGIVLIFNGLANLISIVQSKNETESL